MKRNIFYFVIVIYFLSQSSCTENIRDSNIPDPLYLREWKLISSTRVPEDGAAISSEKFNDQEWLKVHVPTTVLRALVKENIYPDPHIGMNNFLIPDVSDAFNAAHDLLKYSHLPEKINPWKDPYWYRTTFKIPEDAKGRQIWLNFDGINYRADVWLNGTQIADSSETAGMFQRFKFNITDYIKTGTINYLTVKIYQTDHPGTPDPGTQFNVFGPTRGHSTDIFKDVTLKLSGGWDCAPVVRDRNIGIYQNVFLSFTGPVDIRNPYIVTDLPLPDTTSADLTITAELVNISNITQAGLLKGRIDLINELEFPSYTKVLPGRIFEFIDEINSGKKWG